MTVFTCTSYIYITFFGSTYLVLSICFVCVQVFHPYSSSDTATPWKIPIILSHEQIIETTQLQNRYMVHCFLSL